MKYITAIGFFFLFSFMTASGQVDSSLSLNRTQPMFPGGVDSLYVCLEQYFRISRTELQFQQNEDLTGDVRLTINRKGQVIHVNSGMTRIEYELERAFMSLPPFIPATVNGKPVTSYVELKFMFFIAGNRMKITDHLLYHTYVREKENSWLKAALVAGAVVVFLIFWGI